MTATDRKGHTARKWTASRAKTPDNTGGFDWAVCDEDYQIIAEAFEHTGYAGGTEKQYIIQPAEANARLIAAAPEILAALEACQSALATLTTPRHTPRDDSGVQVINCWAQCVEAETQARAAIIKAQGASHD